MHKKKKNSVFFNNLIKISKNKTIQNSKERINKNLESLEINEKEIKELLLREDHHISLSLETTSRARLYLPSGWASRHVLFGLGNSG